MKTLTLIFIMFFALISCKNSSKTFDDLKAPAIYYGAVSSDSVMYSYKRGNLSIDGDQPINDHSQFALFSITKTFTAMGIMQLVQSGSIHLEDRAKDYLPQYDYLGDITIRQLLSHQSGINNPLPISWIHLEEEEKSFDYEGFNKEVLTEKAKIKSEPGKKAAYSNLNFVILGDIIAKVSGLTYHDYIEQKVLNTLEIGFHWKEENVVTGYHESRLQAFILGFLLDKKKYTDTKTEGLLPFKKAYLNGSAHGGLLASPTGLNTFLQELLNPESQFLSQEMKRAMFEEQTLSNGKPSGRSLGWFAGNMNGNQYVHHAGGGGGYYLELRIYPEKGIATYLLTNKSGFSDQRLLEQLDSQYLHL